MSASGTRHVGRVTDPLARDDGETEPELELEAEVSSGERAPEAPPSDGPATEAVEIEEKSASTGVEPEEPASELRDPDESVDGVHPVRARLLARAAGSRARPPRVLSDPGSTSGRLDDVGQARLDGGAELDALGVLGGPPSAPVPGGALPPRARAPLSPNMIAVFGTLLGLAMVASIIALVMRVDTNGLAPAPSTTTTGGSTEAALAPAAPAKRERVKLPGPWRIVDAKGESGNRVAEGKVGASAFLTAVQEAGVEKKEAYRVFNALKDLRNLDKCDRNDTFLALIDRASSRVKAFEYVVTKEEVYQLREGQNGELTAKRLDFKVERAQVKGSFVVDGDIDTCAERGGLERGMASALTKALDGHMSLDELKRGDVVRVVAQEVTVLGEFSRYAGIEALEIRRGDDKEHPFRLYFHRGTAERGYYDEKGRSPYEGGWRKPVKDAPITSRFNPKRMHPVLKKIMPHTGTDFGAPTGAEVGASSYGTISFIGPAGPSGNLVKVEHPGGIETGYAHLSRFAAGLKVGDKVKRLQLVGYVGSTGRSTGPHLHFTAKKNGEFIDAETLNLDGMRVIGKDERDVFAKVRKDYDEMLDAIPLPAPLAEKATAAASAAEGSAEPSPPDEEFATGGPGPGASAAPTETTPTKSPEPAAQKSGNPVFLTDKDLQKAQGATDEGEVDE